MEEAPRAQVGRFPSRGTQNVYRVPGDLSRPSRPTLEEQQYSRVNETLVAQFADEREEFVRVRSDPAASAALPSNMRLASSRASTAAVIPRPVTPLVSGISCRQSQMSALISHGKSREDRISAVSPRGAAVLPRGAAVSPRGAVVSPRGVASAKPPDPPDVILARYEQMLAQASGSVCVAKSSQPSRQQVAAAAAHVAEAKKAFATMRGEVVESLNAMKQQMARDVQDGLAKLTVEIHPDASSVVAHRYR